MVALQDIALRAIEAVYPHPLVGRAAGDKPVLQDGVDGCGRGRVGQGEAVRLVAVRERGDEGLEVDEATLMGGGSFQQE